MVHVCRDADGLKGKNWFVSVRCERFPLENVLLASIKPSDKTSVDFQRAAALNSEWIVTLSAPWCVKNALPVSAEISLNSYVQQRDNGMYCFEKMYSKLLGSGEIAKTHYVDPGSRCVARVESIAGGWEPSQDIDRATLFEKNLTTSTMEFPFHQQVVRMRQRRTKMSRFYIWWFLHLWN